MKITKIKEMKVLEDQAEANHKNKWDDVVIFDIALNKIIKPGLK